MESFPLYIVGTNFYLKFEQKENNKEYKKVQSYNDKWNYLTSYLILKDLDNNSTLSKEIYNKYKF